jgi:cytochrome c2
MKATHFGKALVLAAAVLTGSARAIADLVPQATPAGGDDLRISGLFQGCPAGAVRYLPRSVLLGASGVSHLHEKPGDSIPAADLTVIRLDALLRQLPLAAGADGVVFICVDRWESFVPLAFIDKVHPYLLLEYAGRTPAQGWPMFGPTEPIAPYYCSWSPALGPATDTRNEYGEFDATQIVEMRAVSSKERYAPFYAGAMARLSPAASLGRKLFIRECNNCHQGPSGVGGNTSQRPFPLLQIHATLNTAYFKAMVTNPKKFYPMTVMPTHEYFTEDMMAQLVAFLSEAKAAGVN